MKSRNLRVMIGVLLLVGLAACESTGNIEVRKEMAGGIPPGKTVALNVKANPVQNLDSDEKAEVAEALTRLRAQLFGRLVAEGVFKQVVQPGDTADYKMDVTMTGAEEVSQGARIFLGVLAGSNSLNASVQLYDHASNALLSDFTVSGQSASHPLSTESGLDDAVREAVTKIIVAVQ